MGDKEHLIEKFSRYISAYEQEKKLGEPEFDGVYSAYALAEFLVGLLAIENLSGSLIEHHCFHDKRLD